MISRRRQRFLSLGNIITKLGPHAELPRDSIGLSLIHLYPRDIAPIVERCSNGFNALVVNFEFIMLPVDEFGYHAERVYETIV